MRTLVAAVLVAVLIVAGVAVAVSLIARPIIVAAVQGASPFGDQALQVDVDCNVFGLLSGNVDRIHVRGANLERDAATLGALDLTLTDVATSGRAFADMSGTLAAISFPIDGATGLTIDTVRLDGSSTDTTASASLDRSATLRLVEYALADGGIDVSGVDLGAGTVIFQVFGTRAEVPLGVEDGAIVLVDPFGTGSYEIVPASPEDPWRFTGVVVTPSGLTIDATIDVERLLAG